MLLQACVTTPRQHQKHGPTAEWTIWRSPCSFLKLVEVLSPVPPSAFLRERWRGLLAWTRSICPAQVFFFLLYVQSVQPFHGNTPWISQAPSYTQEFVKSQTQNKYTVTSVSIHKVFFFLCMHVWRRERAGEKDLTTYAKENCGKNKFLIIGFPKNLPLNFQFAFNYQPQKTIVSISALHSWIIKQRFSSIGFHRDDRICQWL